MALGLIAGLPWLVGAAREAWAWMRGTAGASLARLDKAAHAALQSIGVAELAPLGISPASVQQAAAAFRSVKPGISDRMLRLVLAQTNLESSFGHGWGPGCWNMGAEQCGPGGATAEYSCVDHGDSHADGSKYTAKYKCFGSQPAAATGYLRLLAGDRYVDAYEGALEGSPLAFVRGLYIHTDADGKPAGGWFEGTGNTDEKRWGGYLAGVLARLPAIDSALGLVGGRSAPAPSSAPRALPPGPPAAPAAAPAAPAAPGYAKGVHDGGAPPQVPQGAPDVAALASAAQAYLNGGAPDTGAPAAAPSAQGTTGAPPLTALGGASAPATQGSPVLYTPGQHVSAQWTDGAYYPGTIINLDGAGRVQVAWDDGDAPSWVTRSQVRADAAGLSSGAAATPGIASQYAAQQGAPPRAAQTPAAPADGVASQFSGLHSSAPFAPPQAQVSGVLSWTMVDSDWRPYPNAWPVDPQKYLDANNGIAPVNGPPDLMLGSAPGDYANGAELWYYNPSEPWRGAHAWGAGEDRLAADQQRDVPLLTRRGVQGYPINPGDWNEGVQAGKQWAPPARVAGVGSARARVAGVPSETGTWRDATNDDVAADDMVASYKALLSRPVGTEQIQERNGRIWKLRTVSKATDPQFTTHRRDVRGWIFGCSSPTDRDPGLTVETGHWRDATDDDVAADDVGARYHALLPRPIDSEVLEEHNGRVWKLRTVSKDSDPVFTTHARDVRGWVWSCSDAGVVDDALSYLGLGAPLARVSGALGIVVQLFVLMLSTAFSIVMINLTAKVSEVMGRLSALGMSALAPGSSVTPGFVLVDPSDPQLAQAFTGRAAWLAESIERGWTYERPAMGAGARVAGPSNLIIAAAGAAALKAPLTTAEASNLWQQMIALGTAPGSFPPPPSDVVVDRDPVTGIPGPAWAPGGYVAMIGPNFDLGLRQTLGSDRYNGLLSQGYTFYQRNNGWNTMPDADATVRGVGAGAGGQDLRGLMLQAIRAGTALNTDSLVEVEVPALDLVITVPRRAFRAPVRGYAKPLLLGWSYANQIEACNALGMISMTWQMVDAVWRAPFTWRIKPTGLWAPGADLAMQRTDYALKHTDTVDATIAALDNGNGLPPDAVCRPEGKAWILDEHLPTSAGAVLWGWQGLSGKPLQGFGFGHDSDWADYSMCEPPCQRMARVLSTGQPIDLLTWYRGHFPAPAMQPFLDVYDTGAPS